MQTTGDSARAATGNGQPTASCRAVGNQAHVHALGRAAGPSAALLLATVMATSLPVRIRTLITTRNPQTRTLLTTLADTLIDLHTTPAGEPAAAASVRHAAANMADDLPAAVLHTAPVQHFMWAAVRDRVFLPVYAGSPEQREAAARAWATLTAELGRTTPAAALQALRQRLPLLDSSIRQQTAEQQHRGFHGASLRPEGHLSGIRGDEKE